MSDIAGSIRKVTLDGMTFDAMGDANIKEVGSKYENTSIVTSGRNVRKMMKRSEDREGITLAANGLERDILKDLAERTFDFPMSYTTASGDTYKASGFIEFESRETESNTATIKMMPRDDWHSFLN